MNDTTPIRCPFCSHSVDVNIAWAYKNKLIFCDTCCKSFEVQVKEPEKDLPPIPACTCANTKYPPCDFCMMTMS